MAKQVKRFSDLETKAFPEVDDHRKIDDVRDNDFLIKDHSEPMKTTDENGAEKMIVIVLASDADDPKKEFTFTAGGVVMEKVLNAKAGGYLPLLGQVTMVTGKNKRKYNDIV